MCSLKVASISTHENKQMFDARPSTSGGGEGEEEDKFLPKRLLTEDDIKRFVGGRWPVKGEDAEYADEGNASDVSDEGGPSKRARGPGGWSEDPLAAFVPGTHFLEAAGAAEPPGGFSGNVMPFFEMVLPPPIVELTVTCTNQSAEILKVLQTKAYLYGQWKPITEPEFRSFLGLLYHMEDIKMERVKDYWKKGRLFNIPIFQNTMPKHRFLGILGALSFNILVPPPDEKVIKNDTLYKIRPLLDHFNNLITSLHCPGIPSFEESMDSFKINPLFTGYSWYKRVGIYMIHTLLQIGCIIYNDQFPQKKMKPQKFRRKVVEGLLPEAVPTSGMGPMINLSNDKPHYMSYIGINEKGKKRRKRCKYCIEVRNKRKESYFCCTGCPNHPGFCIDGCFAKYHGYC